MSEIPVPNLTPREIVGELDRFIVGQAKAKRAVAIAMRNRWRRQQVPDDLRDEIAPKNIIMVGPTGVGKTEIARRLAKLAQAPFMKVEASKFTEVGYVGRDVESMIRDLVGIAINMVREEHLQKVEIRAKEHAEDRLVELLSQPQVASTESSKQVLGPFVVAPGGAARASDSSRGSGAAQDSSEEQTALRERLRRGELDEDLVELDVPDSSNPLVSIFGGQGMEEMQSQLQDMFSQIPQMGGAKSARKKIAVADARRLLEEQEAQKLLDMEQIKHEAVVRTEQSGIVFLDEIDKVASRQGHGGADVSREGVQRDLLPIVEGCTVNTKHGPVKTDHILFVAAGAFHVAAVSDLIPELQGRFPIRVELDSLEQADFIRILTEPQASLTKQYQALMETEGLSLTFTDDAVAAIAQHAAEANHRAENIGARRLHTVMEALTEELSFSASECEGDHVTMDKVAVDGVLKPIMASEDLARFIL